MPISQRHCSHFQPEQIRYLQLPSFLPPLPRRIALILDQRYWRTLPEVLHLPSLRPQVLFLVVVCGFATWRAWGKQYIHWSAWRGMDLTQKLNNYLLLTKKPPTLLLSQFQDTVHCPPNLMVVFAFDQQALFVTRLT